MNQTSDFEDNVFPEEEGRRPGEQDYQPEDDASAESADASTFSQPDSAEPPEWLRDSFGGDDPEGDQPEGDLEAMDDPMATQISQRESPLGGVVFPGWLTGPKAEEDRAESESSSAMMDETLITDRASLEAMEDADQIEETVVFDSSGLDFTAGHEDADGDPAAVEPADMPEAPSQPASEEFEDELKWLEDLAASHDVADERYEDAGGRDLSPMAEEDYIPDWLKSEIDAEQPSPGETAAGLAAPGIADSAQIDPSEQKGEDELMSWLSDDDAVAVDSGEEADIDWFNQIVEGDESAIDELLAIQGISLDVAEEQPFAEWSDDPDSWLDELEQIDDVFQELPLEDEVEEELAGEAGELEDVDLLALGVEEEFEPQADAESEYVPTDPEEAMAWLEQLATEEGTAHETSALEPAPFDMDDAAIADLEDGDVDTEGEFAVPVPEDPDEAMAWLEQIAAEEDTLDEAMWSFEEEPTGEVGMQPAEPGDEELEAALASIAGIALPSDHDEALAWLEELAANAQLDQDLESAMDDIFDSFPEELEDERDLYKAEIAEYLEEGDQAEPEPRSEALQMAAMAAAAELLELESDEPPDIDEFEEAFADTALLEDEPAGEDGDSYQTGAIDETLPGTLTASMLMDEEEDEPEKDEFDDELIETIITDLDSLEEEPDREGIDQTMIGAAAAAILAEELIEEEDGDKVESEAAFEPDDGKAELVDIFEPGDEGDSEDSDDLQWLSSLEEANVTGWLVAEQALLAEEKDTADDFEEVEAESDVDTAQEKETFSPEKFFSTHQFDDHGFPGLASAQAALVSGQFSRARQEYAALLDSKDLLPYAIADLEIVAEVTDNEPNFMKLLGDAYSRNGQLTKAIEIYRLALDNL